MANNNGYKLYNEEHALFSWHESMADAQSRAYYELKTFGRRFQVAALTDAEVIHYAQLGGVPCSCEHCRPEDQQ